MSQRPQQQQSDYEPTKGVILDTSGFHAPKSTPTHIFFRGGSQLLLQLLKRAIGRHELFGVIITSTWRGGRSGSPAPYPNHCLSVTQTQPRKLGVPPPKPLHPQLHRLQNRHLVPRTPLVIKNQRGRLFIEFSWQVIVLPRKYLQLHGIWKKSKPVFQNKGLFIYFKFRRLQIQELLHEAITLSSLQRITGNSPYQPFLQKTCSHNCT